jgi:uncharacterized protein YlbG (UPF0298 family)
MSKLVYLSSKPVFVLMDINKSLLEDKVMMMKQQLIVRNLRVLRFH